VTQRYTNHCCHKRHADESLLRENGPVTDFYTAWKAGTQGRIA
jgi:hypothetical protein